MDESRGELGHRMAQLEKRFERLEQTIMTDRSRAVSLRRRARWTRWTLFVGVGLLYAYYINSIHFDL